ncbi:hypothetical protein O3M35_012876 [Rhynocoris fuscipes]|uniref:Glucose dehydrogenase [FAD, quinone]-like n=1 Tax=Rhynocoris fuscipes TaxID=488301 RepID=A0AAW1CFQ5_9HEMI
MNVTTFLSTLALWLSKYYPEELDPSMKPFDSSGCNSCQRVHYDFIIVGAGSAGSVLANRLSENPNWKVLLLEAGDDEDYVTDTPALTSVLFGGRYNWNFTTVKQERSCLSSGGICQYAAGRVMGGTSTINGMDYVRGNPLDYDEWEAMGNPGWSYRDVLPYFLRAENTTIEAFNGSPYHSNAGEQSVGYSRFFTEISRDFIEAAKENGLPEIDYNGRTQIGVSRMQFTMRGATRCSTSKAYLNPIRFRKNLVIFKNTKAIKVLINENSRKAEGVLVKNGTGHEYKVFAKKEVILSAGFMNTPKLLMLSGVGPKEHLQKLGITVVADLAVGDNVQDHSGVSMQFSVNKTALNCCTEYTENDIFEFARNKQGPLTSPSQQVISFLDTKNRTSQVPDVTIIMGIISQQFSGRPDPYIFVYVGNISPRSRGTVRLKSQNPDDQPLVDPNYFADKSDMNAVRRGILKVLQYMNATIMQKYSINWINSIRSECRNDLNILSEENLDCYIKNIAIAGYHGVGTAKMGPKSDRTAVVDSKLKVHGISNLRVVDASVMPKVTRGNPNAPVIMIAEKAADLIRLNYGYKFW